MIWMPILFVSGMLVGVALAAWLAAWLDARGDRVIEINHQPFGPEAERRRTETVERLRGGDTCS